MSRLISGFLFSVGVLGMLGATYFAIALRNYGDYTNQNGIVWPFLAVFIVIALLFCEVWRGSLGKISKKLLVVEFVAVVACILWFILSRSSL